MAKVVAFYFPLSELVTLRSSYAYHCRLWSSIWFYNHRTCNVPYGHSTRQCVLNSDATGDKSQGIVSSCIPSRASDLSWITCLRNSLHQLHLPATYRISGSYSVRSVSAHALRLRVRLVRRVGKVLELSRRVRLDCLRALVPVRRAHLAVLVLYPRFRQHVINERRM
jgi:hypothetical protein